VPFIGSQDSSVGIVTPWVGQPGFNSWQVQEIFLYSIVSTLALGPTQWISGALSLGVKQPVHEASHSPPSSAKIKNGGVISPLTYCMSSWHGA
jgi:hypothetical protein